jgi:hypothetical protein
MLLIRRELSTGEKHLSEFFAHILRFAFWSEPFRAGEMQIASDEALLIAASPRFHKGEPMKTISHSGKGIRLK